MADAFLDDGFELIEVAGDLSGAVGLVGEEAGFGASEHVEDVAVAFGAVGGESEGIAGDGGDPVLGAGRGRRGVVVFKTLGTLDQALSRDDVCAGESGTDIDWA